MLGMPDVANDEGEDDISKNPQSTNNQSNKSCQETSTTSSNTTTTTISDTSSTTDVTSCDPAVSEGKSSSESVESNSNNSSSPHPNPPESATADTSSRRTPGDVKKVGKRSIFYITLRMLADLTLLGFILSTVFSYVENIDKPLTRSAPKPSPFFPQNSLVRDYWKGEVFKGFQDAGYYENSFFFFYATWDRECQEARQQMEIVAKYFSESDILIAAVNCWYPTSDCAKEFGGKGSAGNILPIFIFYPKLLSGIQYRGPIRAQNIIRFVLNSRYAVTHIGTYQHFERLQESYDNVLVGYIPATSTFSLDPNHQELMKTAHSLLEVLPEKQTTVGVVTSARVGKQLHLHSSQPVRLFTFNSTYVYPNKTVDNEKLVIWSLKKTPSFPTWLNLPARKSLSLKSLLKGGSGNTLLMLAPRSTLNSDPLLNLIRQVSADYLNCDNSEVINSFVDRLKRRLQGRQGSVTGCTSHSGGCRYSEGGGAGRSCSANTGAGVVTSPSSCRLKSWSYTGRDEADPACRPVDCHTFANFSFYQESLTEDESSWYDDQVGLLRRELSGQAQVERQLFPAASASLNNADSQVEDSLSVTGLGCSGNRTIRMYRVDSELYASLVDRLGLADRQLPLPVILNLGEESIYLPTKFRLDHMEEDLKRFLVDWHAGQLTGKPGFRSTQTPRKEKEKIMNEESVIKETSASRFGEVISSGKDVVLLYTTRFCTHCTTASHAFHSAKLYLQDLKSIRFMMVDGVENDLDWNWSALSYPAIIFIPNARSEESRVFPADQPLNVRNLLSFVVANLTPGQRLKLALHHCDKPCFQRLRLRANKLVSDLTSKLQRHPQLPRYIINAISRKLSYAKSVMYVMASVESTGFNQNIDSVARALADNLLRQNF